MDPIHDHHLTEGNVRHAHEGGDKPHVHEGLRPRKKYHRIVIAGVPERRICGTCGKRITRGHSWSTRWMHSR